MCRSYCTPMKRQRKAKRRPRARDRLLVTQRASDPLAGLTSEQVATLAAVLAAQPKPDRLVLDTPEAKEAVARLSRRRYVPTDKLSAQLRRGTPQMSRAQHQEPPPSKPGPSPKQRTMDVLVQCAVLEAAGLTGQQRTLLLLKHRPELSEKPSKARQWFDNLKRNHCGVYRHLVEMFKKKYAEDPGERERVKQNWREGIARLPQDESAAE
jgi:hypothetical protein